MPCGRPRRELRSPMTSPTESSGTLTVSSMIGSSSVGEACCIASFMAIDPAVLNACSEESTEWYEPSTRRTRASLTGKPATGPAVIASRTPFSTAGMKPCGMTPPLIWPTNSSPEPGLSGQPVAGAGLLELGDRADVAGAELGDVRGLLAAELDELADALLRVGARVEQVGVGLHRAGVHAEEVDAPGVRIGAGLEDVGEQ